MSVRLVETDYLPGIPVGQMKDGQIGVVVQWEREPDLLGRVVQRHGSRLISIGEPAGQTWSNLLQVSDTSGYRVRLLNPGEKIEVMDNIGYESNCADVDAGPRKGSANG